MKVNATLLLAAIPVAAFVEADAFVSPSARASDVVPSLKRGHVAKLPQTAAAAKGRVAPWSTSALKMTGGGGGEAVSTDGTATIPDEVFNLVKSIIGAGVLSLPAGEFLPTPVMIISAVDRSFVKVIHGPY